MSDSQLLLKDIRILCTNRTGTTNTKSSVPRESSTRDPFRLVKWTPGTKYRLIKRGQRVFADKHAIVQAYKNNTLTCADLTEFCHVDDKIGRNDNKLEPKYVAVFCVGDGYVHPQAAHYKQAYANSKRTAWARAWEMMDDGTPYWCCLMTIRVRNEQQAKRNYQARKKRKIKLE